MYQIKSRRLLAFPEGRECQNKMDIKMLDLFLFSSLLFCSLLFSFLFSLFFISPFIFPYRRQGSVGKKKE